MSPGWAPCSRLDKKMSELHAPKSHSAGTAKSQLDDEFTRTFQVEPVSRISDRVADQVRDYIVDNDLAEGTRLPSERRLAELVGSSRPTVSQALRSLAIAGLIDIRPGAGAFVLRRPDAVVGASLALMMRLDPGSIREVVGLRYALEIGAVDKIVHSASRSGIHALERALLQLRQARGSAAEWIAFDTNFHIEFVRLSENRFITSLFERAHQVVVSHAYDRWISVNEPPAWLVGAEFDHQIGLHEPIVAALRAVDRNALLAALARHQTALVEHVGLPNRDL